jgi:hypothetical protein
MQAIASVTGDEFLVPYNLTMDTGDVLDFIRDLYTPWDRKGFTNKAIFEENFAVSLTSIISHAGFCHNFNIANAEELLNLDLFEVFLD